MAINLLDTNKLKIKYLSYLLVLASWTFFAVLGYFAVTTLEGGLTIFWIGAVVFSCIGGYLLSASLWRREGRLARLGLLVLLPGFVLVGVMFMDSGMRAIGVQPVPLTFTLVDSETQKPIPNASVRIVTNERTPALLTGKSEGRTEQYGSVSLRPEFTFTETSTPFFHGGWIRFWELNLEIAANGYEPLTVQLSDYTGSRRPLYDPPLPPVTIEMKKQRREKLTVGD